MVKSEGLNIKYIFYANLDSNESIRLDKASSANITGGGICFYTDKNYPFKDDMPIYLIITLPGQKSKIFSVSKIACIKEINQGTGQKFKIGFQFLSIKEEHKKVIMDFLSV